MNYSLIGELSRKKIHDHMHEGSIIIDIGWSKNLPSFFKIWFGRIEINQRNFYFEKVSHVLTKNILVIQSEENILTLYFFNTYLHLLSCYLLMCFVRMFQWECSRERSDLAKITKHLHQSKWQIWSFDKCQECAESKIKKNCYSLCLTKRRINDHKNQDP